MKNHRKKRSILLALSALLAAALLTGCASSGGRFEAENSSMAMAQTSPEAFENKYDTSYDDDYQYASGSEVESGAAELSPVYGQTAQGEVTGGDPSVGELKLVYTTYMNFETTEFDSARETMSRVTESVSGFIQSSSLENGGSYRNASYVVRVKPAEYRRFLEEIGGVGQMNSFEENIDDISSRYYDVESRLASAKAELQTLQELLKKTDNMEDIISVQYAISDVQYRIDSLSGELRSFDSLVGYCTIHIHIREVARVSTVQDPPIGFGEQLSRAFKNGTENVGEFFRDLLLGLAEGWFGWLIFLAVVIVAVIVIRRAVKKGKARQEEQRRIYEAQRSMMQVSQQQGGVPAASMPYPPAVSQPEAGKEMSEGSSKKSSEKN